ncbi:MAG: zinc ribbon domain-containing protein [Chloroflexota bacterium]
MEEEFDFDDLDDYFVCPNCYADVPWNAAACPECGSDEETGWAEDAESVIYYSDDEPDEPSGTPLWQKIVLVFLAYVLASPLSAFFEPSSTGFILLSVLMVIAITYILVVEKLGGQLDLQSSSQRYAQAMSDYDSLMLRARGDQSLVERLIAFEREKHPHAGREAWITAALERIKRDNQ